VGASRAGGPWNTRPSEATPMQAKAEQPNPQVWNAQPPGVERPAARCGTPSRGTPGVPTRRRCRRTRRFGPPRLPARHLGSRGVPTRPIPTHTRLVGTPHDPTVGKFAGLARSGGPPGTKRRSAPALLPVLGLELGSGSRIV
jgi:hypothetical protein